MYLNFLTSLTTSVKKIVNIHDSSKFINKDMYMYYLVNVDHNSMAAYLTRK